MDTDKAKNITLEQIERHKALSKMYDNIGDEIHSKDHSDVAEALEAVLEALKRD